MAASSGLHAYGSKIEVSDDDVTYTELSEVVDIEPPAWMVTPAKATHLQSDNAFREFKPGIAETDNVKVTLNYKKAQLNTLYGYLRSSKYFRISAPLDTGETTPSRLKGLGMITNLKLGKLDPEDQTVIQTHLEIKCSGKWTWTSGS